jgi:hypothetical protein
MMVEEMILTTLLLGWLFYRFARQDEERQALLDLAAEHGVELSNERATRAARAGRGALLRERILAGRPPEDGSHGAPAAAPETDPADQLGGVHGQLAGPHRPG